MSFTNPERYDLVSLAGIPMPGLCKVKGARRVFEWESPKSKGKRGGKAKLQNEPPVEFEIECSMWEPEHEPMWESIVDLLKSCTVTSPPSAVGVEHPALALLDIVACVPKEIGEVEHVGKGLWRVSIKMLEFRKAVALAGSTTGQAVRRAWAAPAGGSGLKLGAAATGEEYKPAPTSKDIALAATAKILGRDPATFGRGIPPISIPL